MEKAADHEPKRASSFVYIGILLSLHLFKNINDSLFTNFAYLGQYSKFVLQL